MKKPERGQFHPWNVDTTEDMSVLPGASLPSFSKNNINVYGEERLGSRAFLILFNLGNYQSTYETLTWSECWLLD